MRRRHVPVARRQPFRDEAAGQEHFERLGDVALHLDARPVRRVARSAHRVHAPDGPTDAAPILGVELVERSPAHFREHGVVDPLDLAQGGPVADVDRRDGRNLGGRQVREERVLIEDRLARPAAGAIELHDQPPLVLQLDFIDAVLEGAKRQAAAGAAETSDLDRVQDAVGGQREKRRPGLPRHA